MSFLIREPPPALRPFVKTVWVSRESEDDVGVGARERMLPSGAMHLVIRLSEPPIRLFAGIGDRVGCDLGHAVVGGMRTGFYVRDKARPAHAIGIELRAGMDERLLGASAGELAERHTPLESLWGRAALEMRDRLFEPSTLAAQLDLFTALLARRFAPVRAMHPAVAHALSTIQTVPDVGAIVRASGYSHRRFIALFRAAVGISPKRYQRVLRFERVLRLLIARPPVPMVEAALAAGYSDQPHFTREFREFAGISPTEYRQASPVWTQHVPLPPDEVNSVQDDGPSAALEPAIVSRERRSP
jgi:AraC-like DNA-binding protein